VSPTGLVALLRLKLFLDLDEHLRYSALSCV